MDFEDREDEQEGLPKWPFLASALFILCGALGFAYYHYHFSGELEVWQLLVCILASGTASLLIFMPFLLERSLQLCLLTANRKDDELFRKVYFDLKEVGNELEALAVKVDKVPTLVDKIVSDSTKDFTQLNQLSTELSETKEELVLKLARLEELATQEQPLPEPDPEIAVANKAISDLSKSVAKLNDRLNNIQSGIDKIPTEFPAPVIQAIQPEKQSSSIVSDVEVPEKETVKKEASIEEILAEDDSSSDISEKEESDKLKEEFTEESEEENFISEEQDLNTEEETEVLPIDDQLEDEPELSTDLTETEISEEPTDEDPDLAKSKLEEETFDDLELEEPKDEQSETEKEEETSTEVLIGEGSSTAEEPEELDLGLPAPEETLRKVDALLAGESTSPQPRKEEEVTTKKAPGGMTTVIAKVMIGIGNKPFVRGEGPGLSWDEGVAMNFLEIGKWAWSPARKNASLTIQIYRNDEDPDQSGKHEIKPGEKFEITPDFG